jgi:hypothetical protein
VKNSTEIIDACKSLENELRKTSQFIDDSISKVFPVGSVWKYFYGEKNINNKKVLILAIVENHVVFKFWGKHKRRWFYDVDSAFGFAIEVQSNVLFKM